MLENLTEKMGKALRNLRGVGTLSEANMTEALSLVRNALLSADVNFKVARNFVENVKEKCIGQEIIKSINPSQMAIKIINDELVKLLGDENDELSNSRPLKIMMVGLHGSGKTTTSVKLAKLLSKKTNIKKPALIACDVYRPAAIDQLRILAENNDFLFFSKPDEKNVPKIGKEGLAWALEQGADLIIFDTAGRLQIDEDLIEEIKDLKKQVDPQEVLLVADSALGANAVDVAKHFNEAVQVSGIVLTKLDGDAKGGAALSMKSVTSCPIKFMGTGEKVEDFDIFYPDRIAQRILGMGDIVSLVETAQENIDEKEAMKMAEKMRKADFTLEDFLKQMQMMKKMGPLDKIAGMIPGLSGSGIELGDGAEKQMKKTEAIILSMTIKERQKPNILNASRRLRIAKGSGVQVRDVNLLLKQFEGMRKMMKMFKGAKGKAKMARLASQMGSKFPKM